MTGSLAYRKNEAAILSGDAPEKYTRLLPFIPGDNVLEVGSAEGVLALLLAKSGKFVTALEKSADRDRAAKALSQAWHSLFQIDGAVDFRCGAIAHNLDLLLGKDTLVCVRSIYYFGDDLNMVFAEASRHVKTIVLCGNKNRAARWLSGKPDAPLGEMNRYAAREGMVDLLRRHGYRIAHEVLDGDPIVVGTMD